MKIEDLKIKNGVRVVLAPNENSSSVTALISAGVGSDFEEKRISGISHLLEHMVFKGTVKRPNYLQITQEFENLGAFFNAYTTREYTTYFAKSSPENFSNIFDLLSDIYTNALFNENELKKEKGVVIEEIKMYNDQPDSLASFLAREITFGDTPEGRSIAGKIETVDKITREDLVLFRDKYYCSSNTIVIVSGNFKREEVLNLIEDRLANLPNVDINLNNRKPSLSKEKVFLHKEKNTEQTHIFITFPSFASNIVTDDKMILLKYILGGGLSSKLSIFLREELGASYYVYSDNEDFKNYGLFEIAAGIKTELIDIAMSGISRILNELKTNLISEEEFIRAQESLSGKIAISLDTSDAVASFLNARAITGRELITPAERIKRIRSVKSFDILDLAKKIFKKENVKVVFVGPSSCYSGINRFLEYLS